MAVKQYTNIAIGDIGTQLFWFNPDRNVFEYAVPVTAGAEFGGDTESFDAPETDLDYIPKVGGRTSINDISYTINYTAEKYRRVEEVTNNIEDRIYMEVLQDGSAMLFKGTSGIPTLTAGDVRQINMTIIPSFLRLIANINDLVEKDILNLDALNDGESSIGLFYIAKKDAVLDTDGVTIKEPEVPAHIRIDIDSIPKVRQNYKASKVADTKGSDE